MQSPKGNHREPTGMCYYSYVGRQSDGEFAEYSPCKTQYDKFYDDFFANSHRDDSFVSTAHVVSLFPT